MTRPRLTTPVLLALLAAPAAAQPPGGPGGPGFGRPKTELVERFDQDGSGRLERAERDAARKWLADNPDPGRRRRPRFGRPGDAATAPPEPGAAVSPADVATYPEHELHDTAVLRTFFLQFEHDDWETELAAFYRSDVEVPADLVVDGQRLDQVGVRFRGNTSFMMVPAGRKRPLNLSIDFVHRDQRLYGHKTLNLLNGHADPSFLREVLHAWIAGQFTAVPRANLVHVVINGESWGVFASVEQVNRDWLKEAFGTRKGARWRVPPDFRGNGGLKYLGDDPAEYERSYQPKSGVDDEARLRLVELCRVLNETGVDERQRRLPELLHLDDALWFLAIDNVLLDGDGYLTRASDYALYLDPTGVFHPITHDNNEILGGAPFGRGGGGPGRDRGGRGQGPGDRGFGPPDGRGSGRPGGRGFGPPGGHRIEPGQSPLAGSDDENRPLLHRLLAVPSWRQRYLAHVRSMATLALDWQRLGPEVERLHAMIAPLVRADTRKLYDADAFERSAEELRAMVERRRSALLEHPELAGPWPEIASLRSKEVAAADGRRLRVVARASGEVEVASAWLHWQLDRPGPFAAVAMERGDDGAFRAETPPQSPDERIRYYVEVRAAGADGRVAFAPAGASSRARAHRFGR